MALVTNRNRVPVFAEPVLLSHNKDSKSQDYLNIRPSSEDRGEEIWKDAFFSSGWLEET